jgi:hypothetical protein
MKLLSCRRGNRAPLFALSLLLAAPVAGAAGSETGWVDESRVLAQKMGNELRGRLALAMGAGPAKAIEVCRTEAPAIAARLSRESGATLRRTGLRVRNARNAPAPWELQAIESMIFRLAAGERGSAIETHAEPDGPSGERRYAKAIVMEPMCAVCHGERIAPEIEAAIRVSYPRDTATGFKAGELRGAFSVVWPARTSGSTTPTTPRPQASR